MNLTKYFKPMVDALVSWGYERGITVRAAPYDFRYAPDSGDVYFMKLKKLIEDTSKMNREKKVTLLTHSLGCPYTLAFLNRQTNHWKNTYIKQWIALSGIWGGAAPLLWRYASGDACGVPLGCSSHTFMLPSKELWSADEVLLRTPSRSYTTQDFDDFFRDIGFPKGSLVRRNVQSLISPLHKYSPHVTLYCLFGSGIGTAERYTYGPGEFPHGNPSIAYGDGDGTVNARSLKACKNFQQRHGILIKVYPGRNHEDILSDDSVHDYIKSILFQ
ncbi:Group XV phospholipase A2 [Exaiptasia diaphana]|nr:Group XV phospholipase A2 [Exaiptasia diaphana]